MRTAIRTIDLRAARASHHFGLGPTSGERAAMGDDPRGWLLEQLRSDRRSAPPPVASSRALAETYAMLAATRGAEDAGEQRRRHFREQVAPAVAVAAADRLRHAVHTETPFRERLVRLWSNHFTVSRQGKRHLGVACAGYEQEAIRAHLDGHFSDLLLAVLQHPVMLLYLDNSRSTGPNSRLGRRRGRGLNENLAREVLELHTLGVEGGWSQADVEALARMLTGWSVAGPRAPEAQRGRFRFVPAMHEPGAQVLLGRRYADDGEAQARAALLDLARHPATARHVATRLAGHFVSDQPPADAVAHLTRVFLDTDGHLPSLHAALLDLDAAWGPQARKLRSADDWVTAQGRLLTPHWPAADLLPRGLLAPLRELAQMPFTADSPAGWPDLASHWASPNALLRRVELALELGRRLGPRLDARALAGWALPPGPAGVQAARAVARAADPRQGLGLLLAAPALHWRAA